MLDDGSREYLATNLFDPAITKDMFKERSEVPSFLLPGRTEMVSPLHFFERLRHSLSLKMCIRDRY